MSQNFALSMHSRFNQTNFKLNDFKNISLFIAHIFPNYTPADVAAVFERLRIGKVSKVDFIPKWDKNNKKYFAAYIHFQHWFDNTAARNFQSRVLNPLNQARIVYDDPWHWIVLPYKNNSVKGHAVSPVKKFSEVQYAKVYPESNLTGLGSSAKEMDVWSTDDEIEEAIAELEEEMEEVEQEIKENEKYLVLIDSRYVQALEQENLAWRQWAQSWYSKNTEAELIK